MGLLGGFSSCRPIWEPVWAAPFVSFESSSLSPPLRFHSACRLRQRERSRDMGSAAKRKRRHVEPEDSGEEDVIFKEHGSGTDDEQVSGDSDARAYSSSDRQMDASEDEDAEGSEISFEEEEDDDGEEKDGESEGEGDSGSDENSARRKLKPNRGGAEMEELEKEYENLRNQEQTILSGLKRQKDEDFMKGQAIKNQKALWNRNLEFRFLLQKPFSIANKLPQEPLRSQFLSHDENLEKLYSELILSSEQTLNSMLELQEALIEKNVSISVENNDTSNKVEDENDDIWSRIQKMQCRIAPFRNSSIDRWQRKTQVTSGAAAFKSKLHAFNQNISDQVSGHMRDPSRMIDRMMMKRSAVGILGESAEWANEASQEGENAIDGDPELIDDSEFYQQLLKEFFETFDLSSEPAVYTLKKLQTKKRKTVDRRASKSRKIRYHVHEKIINFMAPKPMVLSPMAPKLFENLFGLRRKSEP